MRRRFWEVIHQIYLYIIKIYSEWLQFTMNFKTFTESSPLNVLNSACLRSASTHPSSLAFSSRRSCSTFFSLLSSCLVFSFSCVVSCWFTSLSAGFSRLSISFSFCVSSSFWVLLCISLFCKSATAVTITLGNLPSKFKHARMDIYHQVKHNQHEYIAD